MVYILLFINTLRQRVSLFEKCCFLFFIFVLGTTVHYVFHNAYFGLNKFNDGGNGLLKGFKKENQIKMEIKHFQMEIGLRVGGNGED